MKRMAVLITAAALACTVGAMGVSAAGRTRSRGAACTRQACAFVDADGDGVCDYRTGGCRYDADGDGVCDRAACGRFVDEDGDGLCDNRPAGGCGGRRACRAEQ